MYVYLGEGFMGYIHVHGCRVAVTVPVLSTLVLSWISTLFAPSRLHNTNHTFFCFLFSFYYYSTKNNKKNALAKESAERRVQVALDNAFAAAITGKLTDVREMM